MTDITKYLAPGRYIDSGDERVIRQANKFLKFNPDKTAFAERTFLYVREQISYYPCEKTSKASEVLVSGYGNSTGNACLLAALCRVAGIPAGISFLQILDKKAGNRAGEKVIKNHAIAQVFLDNRWLKLDPSLDWWSALSQHCDAPSFGGLKDAVLPNKDWDGHDSYKVISEGQILEDVPDSHFS